MTKPHPAGAFDLKSGEIYEFVPNIKSIRQFGNFVVGLRHDLPHALIDVKECIVGRIALQKPHQDVPSHKLN